MSLSKHKRTGPGEVIRFKRRKQKRNPRRLLEAVKGDWERWDHFAKLEGLNWSEFTRRALEQRCSSISDLVDQADKLPVLRSRLPGLSEKVATKNGSSLNGKTKASGAGRKA
jgi:hypothetical protein